MRLDFLNVKESHFLRIKDYLKCLEVCFCIYTNLNILTQFCTKSTHITFPSSVQHIEVTRRKGFSSF